MDLRNDEMILWKDRAYMMVKGPGASGEFILTNKRLAFMAKDQGALFVKPKETNLWDIALERVQDVDIHHIKGVDHPVVRVHSGEGDNYFTFPRSSPHSSLSALRLFINSARRIEREMDLIRGIERSLKDDRLHLHGKVPALIKDLPLPADQVCFQCGKELQEVAVPDPDDISECTVCDVSAR